MNFEPHLPGLPKDRLHAKRDEARETAAAADDFLSGLNALLDSEPNPLGSELNPLGV